MLSGWGIIYKNTVSVGKNHRKTEGGGPIKAAPIPIIYIDLSLLNTKQKGLFVPAVSSSYSCLVANYLPQSW